MKYYLTHFTKLLRQLGFWYKRKRMSNVTRYALLFLLFSTGLLAQNSVALYFPETTGIEEDSRLLFLRNLSVELQAGSNLHVIDPSRVGELLQDNWMLSSCQTTECYEEIGDSLGVDILAVIQLQATQMTMVLFDVRNRTTLNTFTLDCVQPGEDVLRLCEPMLSQMILAEIMGTEPAETSEIPQSSIAEYSKNPILILSPAPDERVLGTDILIASSFFNLDSGAVEQVYLAVDGRDISQRIFITPEMMSVIIPTMESGKHHITLAVDSLRTLKKTWSFTVIKEDIPPPVFTWKGKLTSRGNIDRMDEEELSVGQTNLSLKGTVWDWLTFRTMLRVTTEESPYLQPRNKAEFGVNFGKYAEVNIGDFYPRFSFLTLNGKRIRGADLKLKLGWFNLDLLYGDVNRDIQGEMDKAYASAIIGPSEITLDRTGYTFQQNVWGVHLGFGYGKKFRFGLNAVKVKDDAGSINSHINNANIAVKNDTVFYIPDGTYTLDELTSLTGGNIVVADPSDWSGATPQDNIVFGTDVGVYLDKKRFLWEAEVSLSLLNRDHRSGALTLAGLDTLADDSVDNKFAGTLDLSVIPIDPADIPLLFIYNENVTTPVPINPDVFNDTADVSWTEAIISMPTLAFKTRTVLNYFSQYITVEYSQIGPEYMCLANPYLQQDRREFIVSDKVRLFHNRMIVSLSYNYRDNAILRNIGNVDRQQTFSAGGNLYPGRGLPSLNFRVQTVDRWNGETEIQSIVTNQDTSYVDEREHTQSLNLMTSLNYRTRLLGAQHDVSATFVQMEKKDQIANRNFDTTFIDPAVFSRVMNASLRTRYSIPLRTMVSLTSTESRFNLSAEETATQLFHNISLNADYTFSSLGLTASGGINAAQGSGQTDFKWGGVKGGIQWKFKELFFVDSQIELRRKITNDITSNMLIGRVSLTYMF